MEELKHNCTLLFVKKDVGCGEIVSCPVDYLTQLLLKVY